MNGRIKVFLSRGPVLVSRYCEGELAPLQAAQQGMLPTEHWETVLCTVIQNSAAEAVVGSPSHNVQ